MQQTRVFSVAGYSGSGKTTLIIRLLKELQRRGFTVGVVKSTSKDIVPPEQSDTGKFIEEGSSVTVLLGPSSTSINRSQRIRIQEALHNITLDFVIVEGAKFSNLPKFWCLGDSEVDPEDLPPNVKAIVVWGSGLLEDTELKLEGMNPPIILSIDIPSLVDIIQEEAVSLDASDV